jgi:hypothetical protein
VTEAAVLTIPSEEYHSGEAGPPRLSASVAHILCTASPKHAWTAHPILLEGDDVTYVIHADDWRTKVAKEEREYARSLGKIPLLARNRDEVAAMVDAVREQLDAHEADPPIFAAGKPEQSLLWEDHGVLCKARLDWLRDDGRTIDDLKTTWRSAEPGAYSRALYGTGGDIQAAMYLRGLRAIADVAAEFRWVVVETSPPYALSVITPAPDVLAVGDSKVEWAMAKWRECIETDSWPAYPARVATAELPPWEESRWLERRDAVAA